MVRFRFGGHKAGDPTADDAFAQVFVHIFIIERLGELGAGGEEVDATFQFGDNQHQRDQRRRVRLGGLSQSFGGAAAATMDPPRRAARASEWSHEGTHGAGLDGDNPAALLSTATRASQDRSRDSETGEAHRSLQQARSVQRLQNRTLSGSSGFLHQGTLGNNCSCVRKKN